VSRREYTCEQAAALMPPSERLEMETNACALSRCGGQISVAALTAVFMDCAWINLYPDVTDTRASDFGRSVNPGVGPMEMRGRALPAMAVNRQEPRRGIGGPV
jgi:hypothetical protein